MGHFTVRDVRPGFIRRAVAYGIDSLFVLVIWFAAMVVAMMVENRGETGQEDDSAGTVFMVVFLALPLFWAAYQCACNGLGKSPGKRALGLDIVRVAGFSFLPIVARPGVYRGFLRTLGQFFGGMALGLGYLWALWDDGRRTWGDKMAGTRVVTATREARIPKPDRKGRIMFRDPVGGRPMKRFLKFAAIGLPLYYVGLVVWDAVSGADLTPGRLALLVVAVPLMAVVWFGFFVMRQTGTWVQLTETGLTINSLTGITPGGPSYMRRKLTYDQLRSLSILQGRSVLSSLSTPLTSPDKLRIEYWNAREMKLEFEMVEMDESLVRLFVDSLSQRMSDHGYSLDVAASSGGGSSITAA